MSFWSLISILSEKPSISTPRKSSVSKYPATVAKLGKCHKNYVPDKIELGTWHNPENSLFGVFSYNETRGMRCAEKRKRNPWKWTQTDKLLSQFLYVRHVHHQKALSVQNSYFSEYLSKSRPYRWNFWMSRMSDISRIDLKCSWTTWKILKMSTLILKMIIYFCLMVNFLTFTYLGIPGYVTKILSWDESTIIN